MNSRVLKDWLESYLIYVDNSEPPYTFKLWTGISVIASCMRRKCVLKWGSLTFYPNMYIVLVGPSGSRKGTAMGPGADLLSDIGIKVAAESITREALIRELKQSNDTQVDASTGTMHLHSSLTIFSEELTVFLGYNNQALMADLCNWYDCRKSWTYRTKNMGSDEILGVWVNLMGATTPELLQTTLPRDAIGGGLTSRIIFVYEPKKGKISPFPSFPAELRDSLLLDLEKIAMLSGEFTVSEDFIDEWINWYSALDRTGTPFEDYRFAGYFERRPTHMLKLCMILSASRGDSRQITLDDFERAKQILFLTEQKMPYTFSGVGSNKVSDITHRIMVYISLSRTITFSRLLTIFYQDIDKWGLEKIVDTLLEMKYIDITYQEKEKVITYLDKNKMMKL